MAEWGEGKREAISITFTVDTTFSSGFGEEDLGELFCVNVYEEGSICCKVGIHYCGTGSVVSFGFSVELWLVHSKDLGPWRGRLVWRGDTCGGVYCVRHLVGCGGREG